MKHIHREEIVRALADAVHSLLLQNRAATVPGLGTLNVVHTKSRTDHKPDGSIVIVPPRRVLSFTTDAADG